MTAWWHKIGHRTAAIGTKTACITAPKSLKVAEGTGFEPAKGFEPLNGLANRRGTPSLLMKSRVSASFPAHGMRNGAGTATRR